MPKRPDPELIDTENPEWTARDFARARPAAEVLPGVFDAPTAKAMLKARGRPRAAAVKESTTIRLSPEVMAAFKATGKGWQTRINEALKEWLKAHSRA